jgi:hypothetical protein
MKNTCFIFLASLLILITGSCVSKLNFHMEVLEPGEIVTPMWMKNIVIVDNSGKQPSTVGHTFARNYKLIKDTAFNTDLLASSLVKEFGKQLYKSGIYEKVDVRTKSDWMFEKTRRIDYLYNVPLSKTQLSEFSSDSSLQILLSLDALRILTITHTLMSPEILTRSTRDVWVGMVWRMYDLTSDTLISKIEFSDSLFWFRDDPVGVNGDAKLPMLDSVIPEIASVIAEKMVKKIDYSWVPVTREYFYRGSLRMRDAADWVQSDSLDRAVVLWEQEYNRAHFRNKYRSAMNMMLYYEAKGQPDVALVWAENATQAIVTSPFGATYADEAYLERWKILLKERSKVQQKLKIYLQEKPNQ